MLSYLALHLSIHSLNSSSLKVQHALHHHHRRYCIRSFRRGPSICRTYAVRYIGLFSWLERVLIVVFLYRTRGTLEAREPLFHELLAAGEEKLSSLIHGGSSSSSSSAAASGGEEEEEDEGNGETETEAE